jgi:hypothetical protein
MLECLLMFVRSLYLCRRESKGHTIVGKVLYFKSPTAITVNGVDSLATEYSLVLKNAHNSQAFPKASKSLLESTFVKIFRC